MLVPAASFFAPQLTLPVPSVCNTAPAVPPAILRLATGPKLALPLTTKLLAVTELLATICAAAMLPVVLNPLAASLNTMLPK